MTQMNISTKQEQSHRHREQTCGCQGGGGGREGDARGKRYGNICISITESLCCTPETNTIL